MKLIKARKDYICDDCDNAIIKGELYHRNSRREGRYDELDAQIGIEYVEWKFCKKCVDKFEKYDEEYKED